jgi:hypothetical protein
MKPPQNIKSHQNPPEVTGGQTKDGSETSSSIFLYKRTILAGRVLRKNKSSYVPAKATDI